MEEDQLLINYTHDQECTAFHAHSYSGLQTLLSVLVPVHAPIE